MDFFAQQHRARRNTTLMVVLFLAAVAAIVAAVNIVVSLAWMGLASEVSSSAGMRAVPGPVLIASSLLVLVVIAGGTLVRVYELSKGGAAVAAMVGARRVARGSQDPGERRLLNVVEEMSVASGIAMPSVFVIDDQAGINAFAAGYSPNEAALTVTRGALERLNRDELQGVVGHEFSHILNGDMRLNVRLMGVIAGIVLIGSIGRFLMNAGRGRGSSRSDARLFVLGLALWIVGWAGVFFGRLIKAAVSREREYLADAASVQFTRNPEGIAGALYKIGRSSGRVSSRYAEELSHMYFCEAVDGAVTQLFDTHPPLEARIERVLGDRALLWLRSRAKEAEAAIPDSATPLPDGAAVALAPSAPAAGAFGEAPAGVEWGRRSGDQTVSTSAGQVIASVGSPTSEHMDYARRVLQDMPESVRQAITSVDGAQAALLALLVASSGETRDRQAIMIRDAAGIEVVGRTLALADALRPLGPRIRLPLLDLVMPTLKGMSESGRDRTLKILNQLADADRRMSMSEFVLITLCRRLLAREFKGVPPVKYRSLRPLAKQVGVVLSMLVHAGRSGEQPFAAALAALGLPAQTPTPVAELNFAAVEGALYQLKLLAPLAKPAFIKACLAVIMADQKISVAEGELMRAICAVVDSPLPPILESLPEDIAE